MTEDFDDDMDDLFGGSPKKEEKPKKKEKTDEPKEEEKPKPEEDTAEEKEKAKPEKQKKEKPKDEPNEKEEPKEKPKSKPKPKPEPKNKDLFGDEDEDEPPKVDKNETTFDLSPDEGGGVPVVVIYGRKGHSKTHLSCTFPGLIDALCFDDKTKRVADKFNAKEGKQRITVYDGTRYLKKDTEDNWLETSNTSWRYVNQLLDKLEEKGKTEWLLVDGGEITHSILEMVMRYQHDVRAFGGVKNRNIWKYRKMLIDQLLTRCCKIAKKGVIWTSYVQVKDLIEDGELVATDEMPKWIDAVLYRTDTVIRVKRKTTKNGQRFFATVETSKWDAIPDGPRTDVTDAGIEKLLADGVKL